MMISIKSGLSLRGNGFASLKASLYKGLNAMENLLAYQEINDLV